MIISIWEFNAFVIHSKEYREEKERRKKRELNCVYEWIVSKRGNARRGVVYGETKRAKKNPKVELENMYMLTCSRERERYKERERCVYYKEEKKCIKIDKRSLKGRKEEKAKKA